MTQVFKSAATSACHKPVEFPLALCCRPESLTGASFGCAFSFLNAQLANPLANLFMQRVDEFLMRFERAMDSAVFDVLVGLGQSGIDDAALGRRAVLVGAGEFRAIYHPLGREPTLSPLH